MIVRIKRKAEENVASYILINKKSKTEVYERISNYQQTRESRIESVIQRFMPIRIEMDSTAVNTRKGIEIADDTKVEDSIHSSDSEMFAVDEENIRYEYYRLSTVDEKSVVDVKQVEEDEVVFVNDIDDADSCDYEYEEDSNAEDYYLNDYPDEQSEVESDDCYNSDYYEEDY